jgi:phospholipid/cholesterol/gamma-HCH transport system ATP-binding protein
VDGVRGLRIGYEGRTILENVDFDVTGGEVFVVLGGSGSGKSTLLKLIGGQLEPGSGSVRVDGKVVHELGSDDLYTLRRKMGMMFQSSGLFTDLSVYENIAFPIREHYELPEELVRSSWC